MKKIFFFFIFLGVFETSYADLKDEIILNLKKTDNLSFDFIQTINDKSEKGNCVIEYQKKIFCLYDNYLKKILVSNGKALVIKNQTNNQYYFYPLKKTPLDLILDKNFLIRAVNNSDERIIEDKFINYSFSEKDNEINIFFDKNTYELIGWQTLDIYQNLSITFISSIIKNQKLNKNLIEIPKQN